MKLMVALIEPHRDNLRTRVDLSATADRSVNVLSSKAQQRDPTLRSERRRHDNGSQEIGGCAMSTRCTARRRSGSNRSRRLDQISTDQMVSIRRSDHFCLTQPFSSGSFRA